MKIGTVEEHALLMASMFRAIKYETIEDIEEQFLYEKLLAIEKSKHINIVDYLKANPDETDFPKQEENEETKKAEEEPKKRRGKSKKQKPESEVVDIEALEALEDAKRKAKRAGF